MRQRNVWLGLVAGVACSVCVIHQAVAAVADWQDKPYPYSIVSQDVVEAIRNFGYNCGLRVSIGPAVSGAVRGRVSEATARKFLDAITKLNDLDWYSDGTVLYVSPTSEEQTAVVNLNHFPLEKIEKDLADLNLIDARYRLSQQIGGDAAVISGPPSFVTVVKQAVESEVNGQDRKIDGRSGLVVFRGSQSSSLNLP